MTLRLEDADHNLLRSLALVRHTSANQLVIDLIRAEVDRAFPGKRQRLAQTTPEQREAALLAALGLTKMPELDDDDVGRLADELNDIEDQQSQDPQAAA
jgi:hypothetical protein